jgi:hypothetical protein
MIAHCEQEAELCRKKAAQATDAEDKELWTRMAEEWLRLALDIVTNKNRLH